MQRPEAHQRHHEFGQHAGNYADWPVWDSVRHLSSAGERAAGLWLRRRATRRVGAMLACVDVNRAAAPIVRHD